MVLLVLVEGSQVKTKVSGLELLTARPVGIEGPLALGVGVAVGVGVGVTVGVGVGVGVGVVEEVP